MKHKFIVALVSVFACVLSAQALTEVVDGIKWTYTVSNGNAILGGISPSNTAVPRLTKGAITIPTTLGGYLVTSIGNYAFYQCGGLTSITIPGSVIRIGDSAFSRCSGLTSVTISDGVTSIGANAFSFCDGLTKIIIPSSVTNIGEWAFSNCSGLMTFVVDSGNANYSSANGLLLSKDGKTLISGVNGAVTIPDSVASIMAYAFSNRGTLTSVTIPNSVRSIQGYAFDGCSGLSSVTIPDSVTGIEHAFVNCSGLMSFVVGCDNVNYSSANGLLLSKDGKTLISGVNGNVAIPDGVTSIRDWSFNGCSGLTSVTIPNSVTSIGDSAFYYCIGLMSVMIGNGVTSIGQYAFCGCSSLTSVAIPENVTSIGASAFTYCSGLKSVIFLAEIPPSGIDGSKIISYDAKVLYPRESADLYAAVVPKSQFGGYAPLTLCDYVGLYDAELSSDEEHTWQGDYVVSHDGSGSLRSGAITHNEESWVEMTVSGAGSLSFWWKASSEYDGDWVLDYCYLSIDGEVKGLRTDEYALEGIAIGGDSEWQKVVVNIEGDGLHTVRWTYKKDDIDEGDVGEDCAWLDDVEFVEWVSVSFNIGEGEGVAPEDISELRGTIVTLPAQTGFNRTDYTFVGWSDGEKTYMPGESYTMTKSGVEFIAVWRRNEISASISSADVVNGGTIDTQGATITISAVTTPAGGTPEIYYTLDGTEPTTNSLRYDGPFEATALSVTVKAFAVMENYFDSDVAEFSFTRLPYSLGECINVAGYDVSTGGDANWSRDFGDAAQDGIAALRSGTIGDNQSTWVGMEVNGAGEIGFWCKISSQNKVRTNKHDYLSVSVDGVEAATLGGGEIGWTNMVVAVEGIGAHTIRWTYLKDDDGISVGEDCAWLDEVVWTPRETATFDVGGKGTVEESGSGGYAVTANEGETLTEEDIVFAVPEAKDAYKVEISSGGKAATVSLNPPAAGVAELEEEVKEDEEDSSGILADVADVEAKFGENAIKAKPTPTAEDIEKGNDETGALPVKTYPGLYYQASWGDDLGSMTEGDKVQATGGSLYLGVIKQKGDKGFYKLSVSEK